MREFGCCRNGLHIDRRLSVPTPDLAPTILPHATRAARVCTALTAPRARERPNTLCSPVSGLSNGYAWRHSHRTVAGRGRTVAERVEVREDSEDFGKPMCLRLGTVSAWSQPLLSPAWVMLTIARHSRNSCSLQSSGKRKMFRRQLGNPTALIYENLIGLLCDQLGCSVSEHRG